MRPPRFQDFALDLIKNTTGTTRVQTLTEAGDTTHPFGVAVTTGTGETRWQFIGQLATGEKHDDPDTPVQGDPVAPWAGDVPADPEGWLAAAVTAAESPEIVAITRWSTRPGEAAKPGLTIDFHNGARIFVRKL
ncbi:MULTISPECIES: hypothetical protein [unclassified Streptomyces]|uniref:hypothetical protein n=1 Tax=unclassified Streptomyces TaxID=2593676 RepID=UPI002E292E40|nr:hypothetical protein [Streptomyces sp. NBC_01429]